MKRQYALFEVTRTETGKARYMRVQSTFTQSPLPAYPKAIAVRLYQGRLLAGAFGQGPVVELRPAKD